MFMSDNGVDGKKVVVIGAGLSGCSAAISAAVEGHDVIIMESRSREHIVEGPTSFEAFQNLTSKGDALAYLSANGIDADPEYLYGGARLTGPSGKYVEIDLNRPHGYFIRRGGKGSLDHQLLERADGLGIEIRFHTRLLDAKENGIITFESRGGKKILKTDVIIGADGLGSTAGKRIVSPLSKKEIAVGIGYHFRGVHGFDPGTAECWIGSGICPGEYAYALPTEKEFSIVTTMRPHLMRSGIRPRDYLNRFMSIPSIKKRMGDAVAVNEITGGVPVSQGGPLGKGRILLTGEAARLTDPLLGFGMINGMVSGKIAGKCISCDDPLMEYKRILGYEILSDLRSRMKIRRGILDIVDDETLDRMIDVMGVISGRVDPDLFFHQETRRRALLSCFPALIMSGGITTTVRFLIPFLQANFSI
jgi:digeranylgeranylglycerophospholipid reductase